MGWPWTYATYIGSNKDLSGYLWKLCPYSVNYTLPSGAPDWIPLVQRSAHTTTSGRMNMSTGPRPGFTCLDNNCYYYTTVCSGVRYFKI